MRAKGDLLVGNGKLRYWSLESTRQYSATSFDERRDLLARILEEAKEADGFDEELALEG